MCCDLRHICCPFSRLTQRHWAQSSQFWRPLSGCMCITVGRVKDSARTTRWRRWRAAPREPQEAAWIGTALDSAVTALFILAARRGIRGPAPRLKLRHARRLFRSRSRRKRWAGTQRLSRRRCGFSILEALQTARNTRGRRDQLHPRSDRSSPDSDLSRHDPATWQQDGESERTDARAGPLSSQTCDFVQ